MPKIISYLVGGLCAIMSESFAQKIPEIFSTNDMPLPHSYYVSLEDDETIMPYSREVVGTTLGLKYEDRLGMTGEMRVEILDWKRQVSGRLLLNKQFGLNYYNIDLMSFDTDWNYGKPYYCRYTDEAGNDHEISFVLQPPQTNVIPEVNIFVNPIQTDCENLSKSSFAFFGDIKGGKSPYQLTWYVVNKTQTELMYQPKEELIEDVKQSPMISVEAYLDYYVMLHVVDACGAVGKQMVHVLCEEDSQPVNTIYVQPIGGFNRMDQKSK